MIGLMLVAIIPLTRSDYTSGLIEVEFVNDRSQDIAPDADLRVAACPEDIMLVVVGGAGIKSAYIPHLGRYHPCGDPGH